MKRRAWVFLAVGAVGVAVLVWVGARVWESQGQLARHRPALPDLSTWPTEAQDRILAADRLAKSVWKARAGMAELARLYQANGFTDEALACYEGLRAVEPKNPRWWHLPAVILSGLGRLDEAEPLFRRAAELAPDYLPAQVRAADVLVKANQLDEAQRIYEHVLARAGEEPYALLGLARVAVARDEWSKAEGLLQRAIAVDADFIGGLYLLSTVYDHFGRKDDVARISARVNQREFVEMRDPWIDELIEDCYEPYYLSVAAGEAVFRRDPATAKRYLQRAASLARNPAPYLRRLGQLGYLTREYNEAGKYLAKAVELAPTDDEAWTVWANVLLAAGKRSEVYRVLAEGLAHCPESGALHYVYGHVLSEDGQMARAIAELRVAKRFRSTQADVYIDLARAYFKIGDIDASVAELKEALAVQPDHPAVLPMLAGVAIDEGDEREAAGWIARMRRQPKIPPVENERIAAAFRKRFGREP